VFKVFKAETRGAVACFGLAAFSFVRVSASHWLAADEAADKAASYVIESHISILTS
jgi:hypothetical protein